MVVASAPRIELHGVSHRFGEFTAVRALDLVLEPGRIHAVIGENGAGKSTVLKLIAGLLRPSAGAVSIDGDVLAAGSPRAAMERGIGLVHQHFMLLEPFTALENVMLGAEPIRRNILGGMRFLDWIGALDFDAARAKAQALAADSGLDLDLDARVANLSVGEKQRLEILRILYRGARAILLDEPTAVLSPLEAAELYRTLRRLALRGHTIAVVTHRLDEVSRFADEVTAMRRGECVLREQLPPRHGRLDASAEASSQPEPEPSALILRLTRAVMGGDVPASAPKPPVAPGAAAVLELRDVSVRGVGTRRLDNVSLRVHTGEIVGIAGIEGNGQRELATALAGLLDIERGTILLDATSPFAGHNDAAARVRAARARGLITVLDDRHHDELLLDATVGDNLVVGDLGLADEALIQKRRFAIFAIEPRSPSRLASELSGGNQQKVVMARAFDRTRHSLDPSTNAAHQPRALVLDQPTRGVDVGTARILHDAIIGIAAAGAGVLVISADLNELRTLCHRIVVLREGGLVAELPPTASDEDIGRAMLGVADRSGLEEAVA